MYKTGIFVKIASLFFMAAIVNIVPVTLDTVASEVLSENTAVSDTLPGIDELEPFTNDIFNKKMNLYHIPGAVVSIVKDGEVLLSKGYGYADLEGKTPVIPGTTLFRIGSVTKLFTANAVMQLAEKGRIDLNEDVQKYLKDFKIRNPYSTKVTMAQLLTHTAGIDSDVIGDLTEGKTGVKPLSQILKERMLPVVREPGRFIQYSSYGMALAGCIVEEVSGLSCADYIERNLFAPLNMADTSFEMNSPELAQGYVSDGSGIVPKNLHGYFKLYPVGGILSTADDMAKFMIAHLNGGEYKGIHTLNPKTADLMHSRHAGFDPRLPGTCYGFCETFVNGLRAIGHQGYSPDGFSTDLCLFPDYNTGIFISINQGYDNTLPEDFIRDFAEHFFPRNAEKGNGSIPAEITDRDIDGTYRFGEYTRSTLIKGDIFGNGEDVKVAVNKDGSITLNGTDPFTRSEISRHAKPVASLAFEYEEGGYIVFKKDNNGKIAYMAQSSDSWHGTYEKIQWYEGNNFQIGLFITCIGLGLMEVGIWFVFLINRFIRREKTTRLNTLPVYTAIQLSGIAALFNVAFYAISMMTWGERLRYGVPLDVKILLCLPLLAAIMTVALTACTAVNWRNRSGSVFFRINSTAATAIGMAFIWMNNYWNFIGFKY